jgi:hypothetical protein
MLPSNQSDWNERERVRPPGRARSRPGLFAIIIACSLFGAVLGFAADRWAVGGTAPSVGIATPAAAGSAPAPAPVAAPDGASTAASDAEQQAIQRIIQRGDEEQAQAFTANDPSVMADTSTADFYQQQVLIDRDLRSNGVSTIKLVAIEWGSITTNGKTATATAFETWSTTYSDGSTDQSRDRNVYTLVQTDGTWKISADDHPDDNAGAGGSPGAPNPTPSAPPQPSQPRVPRGQNTSQNWSGYSATGGTFTAVTGTWTVPQFTPDSPTGADATWVGIGGVDSHDLIQAGTQQTVSRAGATQYAAWVETLPETSRPVPLTVNPGDSVTVSVALQPQGRDQWQVSFTNNTTGQTFQVSEQYTSSMSSAEWVEEAPSSGRGRQIPLDNFGRVDFSQATTVKDGKTITVGAANAQAITMVGRGGQELATSSPVGPDGASFSVTRS